MFRVIRDAGQAPHWYYAAGISRLNGSFCTLASRVDLRRIAELRLGLNRAYAPAASRSDKGSLTAGVDDRRPCVDHEGLRNPVDLWLAGGGKFHRKARRASAAPAEVLPRWRAGIEAEVNNPAIRDALWFGLYTGMRRDEVLTLRWERVDMDALTFWVEETKTGVPLELPITDQLAAILERRRTAGADLPEGVRKWVFPSPTSAAGHVQDPHHLYAASARPGAPSSGSTACATPLSPSPSAS